MPDENHSSSGLFDLLLGARVRERRIGSQLTPEAVAKALGLSVADLEAAEAGLTRFSAEHLVALCPVLRVMPSWFFEGLV